MHVLIVDRSGPIPVQKYGGTERVIWGLGVCLHRLGHRVTFLVPDGEDQSFANVLKLDQNKDLNEQIPEDVDVVHMNYRPESPLLKPYLITMHGNPAPGAPIDINTIFISENQAYRYNSEAFVYNGLLWEDYGIPDLTHQRTYCHFLGKASWKVKNVFGAAKIATRAHEKLVVMGGKRWLYRNFLRGFRHLFNPSLRFKGMVDDTKKMAVMLRSKALIFPVEWHEPFGLAIIESLYAGCAVFGTTNGALKELIVPEIGVASDSTKALVDAVRHFEYDPVRCHDYAVANFHSEVMTKHYITWYDHILAGNTINTQLPFLQQDRNNIETLDS